VKSSGLGKALVITGVVLLVLFVVGVAGALYGFYWLKHKVSTYTAVVSGESSAQVKVAQGHSCVLLSTEELQQVLGVAVERTSEIMEGSDPGCAYYANPDAFAHLQRAAVEQARRDSEKAAKQPGPKTDNPLELLKDANQLEGVVKSFGLSQPDKEGRVFSFTVRRIFITVPAGSSHASAGHRLIRYSRKFLCKICDYIVYFAYVDSTRC
jgi:hypothetical protein